MRAPLLPRRIQIFPKPCQNRSKRPLGAHVGPMLYKSSGLKARKNAQRRPRVSKRGPKPPKMDSKTIQKTSWSPSWTHVLKRYELERPTNSQNAPKSGPMTARSVPNPSQMEPQDPPKSDFRALFGFVCLWLQICMFFWQFCGRICLFFKEPTFKIHAPTQCFVDFHTSGLVSKKNIKNRRKSSRNPSQIE